MTSAPVRVIVTDTNVLVNLIHVSRMELFGRIPSHEFILPDHVRDEITRPEQRTAIDAAIRAGILKVEAITEIPALELYSQLKERMGRGETEDYMTRRSNTRSEKEPKETKGCNRVSEDGQAARLARVLCIAKDTLGSLENAKGWMRQENRALGWLTPMSLLDTDLGTRIVQDLLGRIEHGIIS